MDRYLGWTILVISIKNKFPYSSGRSGSVSVGCALHGAALCLEEFPGRIVHSTVAAAVGCVAVDQHLLAVVLKKTLFICYANELLLLQIGKWWLSNLSATAVPVLLQLLNSRGTTVAKDQQLPHWPVVIILKKKVLHNDFCFSGKFEIIIRLTTLPWSLIGCMHLLVR